MKGESDMIMRKKNKTNAIKETISASSLILSKDTPFAVKESYKAIRTNILHILKDKDKKWFSVTSPCPGTGKTTVAVNLGITFAELGRKTVVIDADMRKPMIARLFSVHGKKGLSEFLNGDDDGAEVVETGHNNLYAVTAGEIPDNPSELLSSDRFALLLSKLSETFDYIIVDTPPVGMVTDAAVISAAVSGTMLVIKQNYTDKERFDATVQALKKVDANILGYVLNAVDEKKYSYRYGRYSPYYGGYYGGYYGREKKEAEKQKAMSK